MTADLLRDIPVDETFMKNARKWLAGCSRPDMGWLLAHADDGVIWGRREKDGSLKLSSDVFSDPERYPSIAVELRTGTLQQVRLFGEGGELLVWKAENGFSARLIEDTPRLPDDLIQSEIHLLWGRGRRDVVEVRDGFSLVREGSQGLCHAPPLPMPANGRLALAVRHYLDFDGEGQAYVALSRLVDLLEWRKGTNEPHAQ